LLFDDEEDAIGLLNLVKLVLTCAKSRLENESAESSIMTTNDAVIGSGLSDDEDGMMKCLEQLGKRHREDNSSGEFPSLITDNDSEQDGTLLSIASIILSLLIAVLELGSKLRSVQEEEMLKSFLPILQPLAEFTDTTTTTSDLSSPLQDANAGMADMAGYAMALIASRQAPEKEKTPKDAVPLSTMDKLRKSIEHAEEDLQSTQPPIRARGMVSLGRLARGYLGIVPKEKVPLVIELEQPSSTEEDPVVVLIQEVLRLSMIALSDSESYVYLAVSRTEAKKIPIDVAPFLTLTCLFDHRLYKPLSL
jgi:hypothetical protein